MEWLWLLLLLVGLGGLWLAIMGVERLSRKVKNREVKLRRETDALREKIAVEEDNFLRAQAAKDFIEHSPSSPAADPDAVPAEFKDAMSLLSSDELLDSMVKKMFGENRNADSITATQSAFEREPAQVAVAQGAGILPIKAKPSTKSALTKSEQKMLKKIKQKG